MLITRNGKIRILIKLKQCSQKLHKTIKSSVEIRLNISTKQSSLKNIVDESHVGNDKTNIHPIDDTPEDEFGTIWPISIALLDLSNQNHINQSIKLFLKVRKFQNELFYYLDEEKKSPNTRVNVQHVYALRIFDLYLMNTHTQTFDTVVVLDGTDFCVSATIFMFVTQNTIHTQNHRLSCSIQNEMCQYLTAASLTLI